MGVSLRAVLQGKCYEVSVGDYVYLFSYETAVGVVIPGFGAIKSENKWSPATGRHIESWPARFEVAPPVFEKILKIAEAAPTSRSTPDAIARRAAKVLRAAGYLE